MKTKPTEVRVADFLKSIDNSTRREDATTLVKLFEKVTGWKPVMWGPTIIGFGAFHCTRENGSTGAMCAVGFSPRKASLSVYWGKEGPTTDAIVASLGKHKVGPGGCLYVNKLADVELRTMEKLIKVGLSNLKKTWPVTAT